LERHNYDVTATPRDAADGVLASASDPGWVGLVPRAGERSTGRDAGGVGALLHSQAVGERGPGASDL